ncbi:hypothetical protein B0H19DRAFT_96785 [Mycena capillaripes]|nr:hypothetical protein B0H19DRAFT_96785 [Mycena capillaripes]
MVPSFIQLLTLLPNISTIQVLWSSTLGGYLSNGLEPHTLRAVRTLVLHFQAFELVATCPNLEQLTIYARWSRIPQLSDLPTYAPNLRAFTCLPLDAHLVQDLVELLPNLAEIPPIQTTDLTHVSLTTIHIQDGIVILHHGSRTSYNSSRT